MNDIIKFYIMEEPYGFLSNFWRQNQFITINGKGKTFLTNEHFYQSMKAKRTVVADWIASAPTAKLAMIVGQSLPQDEIVDQWDSIKLHIMKVGLRAKFTDKNLALLLKWTGNATLMEDSPIDMFWGGALPGSKNMLGKLLMEIRNEINDDDYTIPYNSINTWEIFP